MAADDRSLQPVLNAIDELIKKINETKDFDDRNRKMRTLNFLEAIRAALVAYCEPAPQGYYFYQG